MGSLWAGLKIELLGDLFQQKGYIVAKEIKIQPKPQKVSISEGIIVDIVDDYAVIDGIKVKLQKGGKIFGEKSKQYKGKKFDDFKQLKLGDFANVSGEYKADGYLYAKEVEIYPNIDSPEYVIYKSIDDSPALKKFLEEWDNPNLRPKYFGFNILDNGPIISSPSIHNYITELGSKLIPPPLKEKIKFRFVVFDNPSWNATATDFGLVSVYTGLLKGIENEAQLAAILGHEITHVLYKHGFLGGSSRAKTSKDVKTSQQLTTLTSNAIKLFANWTDKPFLNNSYSNQFKFNSNIDSLTKSFSKLLATKQYLSLSKYNQKHESQSDRVGLYLMSKNNYDPIEAMKIWKKMMDGSVNKSKENDINKSLSSINRFATTYNNYRVVPTVSDFGLFVLNNKLKNMSENNLSNSFYQNGRLIEHPDDQKRFEDLNELVGYYYTPNNTLNATKTNHDELYNALMTAQNESKSAAEKSLREFAAKNKAEYDKQKSYETYYNRFILDISKKTNYLISYEELNIIKLIKYNEFVKPTKCVRSELIKKLNEIHTVYENELSIFLNNFKNNKFTDTEKNVKFAIHFNTAKNYNDFCAQISARMQICDTSFLGGLEQEIDKGEFAKYVYPSKEAIFNVFEHLAEREEQKKAKKQSK